MSAPFRGNPFQGGVSVLALSTAPFGGSQTVTPPAQSTTSTIYTFSDYNPTTTGSGHTAGPVVVNNMSTNEIFTTGGYTTSPVLRVASMTTNETDTIAAGSYFSVTLTGTGQTITRISLKAARGGASTPRGFTLRSSADGYAANLAAEAVPSQRPTWTQYDWMVNIPVSGSITLRFYVYSATSNTSIEVDDLEVVTVG